MIADVMRAPYREDFDDSKILSLQSCGLPPRIFILRWWILGSSPFITGTAEKAIKILMK